MILERLLPRRHDRQVDISCNIGEMRIRGVSSYLSNYDVCVQVPSTRVKTSLQYYLNNNVTIDFNNVTIHATLKWYTLENGTYSIGIDINKSYVHEWKRLLSDKKRIFMHEARSPVAV